FEARFPIHVHKMIPGQYISYFWEMDGKQLLVEMNLEQKKDSTLVTITEKGMDNDDAGIRWMAGNTAGWANFLACLKAWLEYGINLRKGAFDYMRS
ncbi:MAG: SRPBCC domain-containing protein, partial [Syntrophothermus sp.]